MNISGETRLQLITTLKSHESLIIQSKRRRSCYFSSPILRISARFSSRWRYKDFFVSTWFRKILQFIVAWSIFSYFLMPKERRKSIWNELESNPGLHASQATSLTTQPWLCCNKLRCGDCWIYIKPGSLLILHEWNKLWIKDVKM